MKKSMLLGILVLFVMFLVSCGKSPQEEIVGRWISHTKIHYSVESPWDPIWPFRVRVGKGGFGWNITADGKIEEVEMYARNVLEVDEDTRRGTWELSDTEPHVFKISEDGKVVAEYNIAFILDEKYGAKPESLQIENNKGQKIILAREDNSRVDFTKGLDGRKY